jgi:hypothetical protein
MTLNKDVILFVLNNMPIGKEIFRESSFLSGEYASENFVVREEEYYEFHITVIGKHHSFSHSNQTLSDLVEIISKGV